MVEDTTDNDMGRQTNAGRRQIVFGGRVQKKTRERMREDNERNRQVQEATLVPYRKSKRSGATVSSGGS